MKSILNITNGDCAVDIMKKANIPGDFLPWRDILHDGPVPECLSLDDLSKIRAQFIVDRGWGTLEETAKQFIERDNILKSIDKYEKAILWFEHDLYDQLQLLQILDWLNKHRPKEVDLSIICVDRYLGTLLPSEMIELFEYEEPITEDHFILASLAWSAFRSNSPDKWCALLKRDTDALPFLEGAIMRLLDEYPSVITGMSRTSEEALKIIAQREHRFSKIFDCYQKTEERRFLGDSSFLMILEQLLESSPPLVKLTKGHELNLASSLDAELTITSAGKDVLAGVKNWIEVVELDRWVGGVHLTSDNAWCWNSTSKSLSKKV